MIISKKYGSILALVAIFSVVGWMASEIVRQHVGSNSGQSHGATVPSQTAAPVSVPQEEPKAAVVEDGVEAKLKPTWNVKRGKKEFSLRASNVGMVATLPASGAFRGVTAMLQIECFVSPDLTDLTFGVILSKAPPNGFMAWRYQYDDGPIAKKGPYSRTPPVTNISLGDSSSEELRGLRTAKRLRLTLLPADGSALPYEFNVSGAAAAIRKIPCKGSH